MKNFVLSYYRFSYPMKLAEEKNFLISDHLSGAHKARYERKRKCPSPSIAISTRNCYLIIEGWAFVAIAGFSHAFKLLL